MPPTRPWPRALLYLTSRRFPLTPMLYWMIAIHCLVLILGAR